MAEFVMKDMAVKAGRSVLGVNCDSEEDADYVIESAATSREEIGMPVYPPARKKLAENGIGVAGNELGVQRHHARQLTRGDYEYFDMLICMDDWNIRNLERVVGKDSEGKVSLLLDHAGRQGEEVADPWYTGNFDATWEDVTDGCRALINTMNT